MTGTASAPIAVVDQFFHALASGDAAAASALLDPAVIIYESGSVEHRAERTRPSTWVRT